MIAAALLVLVVLGVLGVVAMGVWEARMAATAPRRPALLAVLSEAGLRDRVRVGAPAATAVTAVSSAAVGRVVATRPVRALRAAIVNG